MFSFFYTCHHNKVEKYCLPYYLPIAGGDLLDSYLLQGY